MNRKDISQKSAFKQIAFGEEKSETIALDERRSLLLRRLQPTYDFPEEIPTAPKQPPTLAGIDRHPGQIKPELATQVNAPRLRESFRL